jgi:sugar phosphate isomerase/epimerase
MNLGIVSSRLKVETASGPDALDALFAEAHRLGLGHVEFHQPGQPGRDGWDDPGAIDRVRALQEHYGVAVQVAFGDDYVANGAAQPTERFAEFVECVCRPMGVTIVGTFSPLHAGRWLKAPPLDEQLDRLAAALRRLAPVAEAGGVRLAIENHCDYRGQDLAGVLARVGSTHVGARFDTANTFAVLEEPVAAAAALAPYTFATHIKDAVVEAEPGNRGLGGGLLALRPCTLGEGHVDFPAILALLAAGGPLGGDLMLTMEIPPGTIPGSIAYARQALGRYL